MIFDSANNAFGVVDTQRDVSSLESGLIDRREWMKIVAATSGFLALGRLPELADQLSRSSLENDMRAYLLQSVSVPPEWPENPSINERINFHYRNPLQHLEETLLISEKEAFFDETFPLLIPDQDLFNFYSNVSNKIQETLSDHRIKQDIYTQLDNIVVGEYNRSPIHHQIDVLTDLLYESHYQYYRDVVLDCNTNTTYPIWPTFDRIVARLPEEVRRKIIEDASHSSIDSPRDYREQEVLLAEFIKASQAENAHIRYELEMLRDNKKGNDADSRLSFSEYLRYFVDKDGGDSLRAIFDAMRFAREQTRVVYDSNNRLVKGDDSILFPGSLWMSNLIRDELSLTLPWNYLANFPDSEIPITQQFDMLSSGMYGLSKEESLHNLSVATHYKEFQQVNRIGLLAHVLSIMFLSGCMHESAITSIVLQRYYGVPNGLHSALNDSNTSLHKTIPHPRYLLSGIGEYGYAALVASTSKTMLSFHGKIKFSTDTLTAMEAGSIRRALRRGRG